MARPNYEVDWDHHHGCVSVEDEDGNAVFFAQGDDYAKFAEEYEDDDEGFLDMLDAAGALDRILD